MADLSVDEQLLRATSDLEAGRWIEACDRFDVLLGQVDVGAGWMGLAQAQWWLGETAGSVRSATRAYAALRRAGDVAGAVDAAIWLALIYKSNYESTAVAQGWLRRAETLLTDLPQGQLHAWAWIVQAYQHENLAEAEALTRRAVDVARGSGDADLELVALSQLGHVRVGMGQLAEGFALIDESMAAALGGERTHLDTVVYVCCDMLSSCDLANDAERAIEWCRVADEFIAQYGCPFLNGECRTLYGGLLAASGRWDEADRELEAALRITVESAPRLNARARVRLASLRLRQGRPENAAALISDLDAGMVAESEGALVRAALHLARGDDSEARRILNQRLDRFESRRSIHAEALSILVDACLAAGDFTAAADHTQRLSDLVLPDQTDRVAAAALTARGRVAAATRDLTGAEVALESAATIWSAQQLPFETACCQLDLASVVSSSRPDAAADLARDALDTFDRLGAQTDANRAAAVLRSLGASPRAPRPSRSLLTSREAEVLDLLACGLSNPEIAHRLFVSRKTVAHHVSSILSKLQVRNRTEAATLVGGSQGGSDPSRPATGRGTGSR